MLRATTPCTFSTSQLPTSKSAPRLPVFNTFYFQMCFAPHHRALFRHLNFQNSPNPSVFNTFYFQMCFAPQRRALFQPSQLPKVLETASFYHLLLPNVLPATPPCTFSSSQLPKLLRTPQFLTHFTSKCASRHNAVHFSNISTSKSGPTLRCFVPFHFEIGFAPQRSATFHPLISPDVSAPAALASLLFNPPEPQNQEKTQCFGTFLPLRAPASSFFLIFSLLTLLPADCFFISPYLSEV